MLLFRQHFELLNGVLWMVQCKGRVMKTHRLNHKRKLELGLERLLRIHEHWFQWWNNDARTRASEVERLATFVTL